MKKFLKILAYSLLAIVIIVLGILFNMGDKSYEIPNQVAVTAPYEADPANGAFHRSLFIADMHADSFTFVDTFMERKTYAHLDYPRAVDGGFSLLTMAIATEVPLSMVRKRPGGIVRDGNILKFAAFMNLEPVANWFSNYARGNWVVTNVTRTASDNPEQITLITAREDLQELLADHVTGTGQRIGMLLAIEGAHVLEGDLQRLNELYARGVRMVSLTHAFDNEYGGSSEGAEQLGITPEGEALLARAQELGMTIDIAHASPALVDDVLERARRPIVYSHGGIEGTCDIDRNLRDAALDKIAANGGLIAMGFWTRVLCGESVDNVAASMRYVADRIGAEHLALGSDFDGGVTTVFDATGLPLLTDALLAAGFSENEVRQLMGGNYTRLLLQSLPARTP
jgi:membrane dipeptidase